uniref:KH domain-containing protein n=1 Tax=Strongyloides stercoralis TaxID=6248 RepID=A0A0K0ECP5_STRER
MMTNSIDFLYNNNYDDIFERYLFSSLINNNKNNYNNINLSNNLKNGFIDNNDKIITLYYKELIKERDSLKNISIYHKIPLTIKILQNEIDKLRKLFNINYFNYLFYLPPPQGIIEVKSRKIFIPVDKYPKYNFIGRILGPKGLTAKELEVKTGCKIMIRGKGSIKDKSKEICFIGKPNYQHLNEPLHVLLQIKDTSNRIDRRLDYAEWELKKIIFPISKKFDILRNCKSFNSSILKEIFSCDGNLISNLLLSQNNYTDYQNDINISNSSNPLNFSDFEDIYNHLENNFNID